jgi:hypothetical protein
MRRGGTLVDVSATGKVTTSHFEKQKSEVGLREKVPTAGKGMAAGA